MSGKYSSRLIAIIGISLGLAACGDPLADAMLYAKKKGLSEVQTAAFMACFKHTARNKPMFPVAEGNVVMKSVPMEICACQSKTILSVFQEFKYGSHTAFAVYMSKENKKKRPRFNKKELRPGLKSIDAGKQLEASLTSCVETYKTAHVEASKTLFEIIPLKVPEKKKDKTAAAGAS